MKKKEEGKVFTPRESTEILTYIAQNMVTKTELKTELANGLASTESKLRKEIKASEQRVMDYTDKRVGQAEERIIGMVRKEDEKIDAVVDSAAERNVFEYAEADRLKKLGAFSSSFR
jgi:hypothetical protein